MRLPGWGIFEDYKDVIRTADCLEDYILAGVMMATLPFILLIVIFSMTFVFPLAAIGWAICKIAKGKQHETP